MPPPSAHTKIHLLPSGSYQLSLSSPSTPFLILGGELQNSSLSSSAHMSSLWPKLKGMNVNTVLGGVGWDQVEPEEGKWDWRELDKVVEGAREWGLKLILLWFGSYKNGFSSYTPGWVKSDPTRFPRAYIHTSPTTTSLKPIEVLSPFSSNTCTADSKAFKAFMTHLAEIDGHREDGTNTVIVVQVENEPGILGDSRDRSEGAEKVFEAPVPREFLDKLRKAEEEGKLNKHIKPNLGSLASIKEGSSWSEAFGNSPQTDEIFMAYHYALYVEKVASAGKEAYDIPMFINSWMRMTPEDKIEVPSRISGSDEPSGSGGQEPGKYPSGGPVETVLNIWRLFAPTLSFCSPDIYTTTYDRSCADWSDKNLDQPLFIPEQRRDAFGARRIWSAIGNFGAIGAAPFAIDTCPEDTPMGMHYDLLRKVTPHILEARREGSPMSAILFDEYEEGSVDLEEEKTIVLGDWKFIVQRIGVPGHPGPAFGLLILTSSDTLLCIGEGYQILVSSTTKPISGISSFKEKFIRNIETGEMETGRLLNGDETQQGSRIVMPSTEPDMGGWCVEMFIKAGTRLAEAKLYAV